MKAYRLAKAKYVRDLSGAGARSYGGRWNEKGIPVVYAAENRSLATVEYLVHVPMAIRPRDLSMATLEIPDECPQETVALSRLPADWRAYPAPSKLAEIGTEWALSNRTLILRVPSAVVEGEYNLLINPAHPDMNRVRIVKVVGYRFDERLLGG